MKFIHHKALTPALSIKGEGVPVRNIKVLSLQGEDLGEGQL